MILFLNEDRAYLSWVAHHRGGFVLDGRHRPHLGHLVLHRALCSQIKGRTGRSHWTTGGRFKACSLSREELQTWGEAETEKPVAECPECHSPREALAPPEHEHLTRLEREILEYIVESAAIHLEWPDGPPYRLTVADIGACMAKTPGQLRAALTHLQEQGWILPAGKSTKHEPFPPRRLILPTVDAVRQTPGFETELPERLAQVFADWERNEG